MKIKILPTLVVILLFFTAFNVIAIEETNDDNTTVIAEEDYQISFSQATFKQKGEYVSVNVNEANTALRSTGKPMLPSYTKTFVFPRGTKIKDVECTISDITTQVIEGKIEPTPAPMRRISIKNSIEQEDEEEKTIEDTDVYSSSDLYPDRWYDYKVYSGLIDGVPSIILKVNSYPIRYSPAEDTIYSIDRVDIQVTYEEPTSPEPQASEYDLLIITPRKFRLTLRPLIRHKNKMGISTKVKTVESINLQYLFEGRDEPERIKKFICDAEKDWGIKYVLLVGGLKSHIYANDKEHRNYGSRWWHVPVRYTNIADSYISDLYYGDLYKGEGEFEDWDSNGNGIFAEDFEELDLWPDVYYGRLACRNKFEVFIMVRKIINYEKTPHKNELWFKRMIVAGGITFVNLSGPGYEGQEPDGEWLCNLSLDYMKYHINDPVRIFASHNSSEGPRPDYINITTQMSRGAGFALFQGHGNAFMWDTKWPNSTGVLRWVGGLMTLDFPLIKNDGKLPIVVVGGCHNGIFNVTFIQTLFDGSDGVWDYHAYGMLPVGSCFSWKLCQKLSGGAIGSTGCTDYGIGWPSEPNSLSALLESNFFYKVGIDNVTTLGAAHSGSIEKYINDVNIQGNDAHTYCITEYQLFGDPSLKIGGYGTTNI
jgi:hypothetical protein